MNSQNGFAFYGANKNRQQVTFKFINNLIVIPLKINGKELSFILDTGVNKTILFNLSKNDSLGLKNIEKVKLQGLGDGKPVEALLSKNNVLTLKNIMSGNESIYVILKDHFDFSGKMGITIHGIIGHSLLKNVIAKINYKSKKIDFYNPKTFAYPKCRKCETFPIQFYRKKPYIDIQVQLDTLGNKMTDVKMLIDSGGSDAIWLFEGTKDEIKTPKRFFNDILGEGLSGTIYGNRSRIPKISIKEFDLIRPTVSFLDTISSFNARKFKQRNGSIGGNILSRFKVWIDYPNRKLTLKKNGSFKGGFNYNMSGLEVVYDGKQLVREQNQKIFRDGFNNQADRKNSISFVTSYFYKFKPSYRINKVVSNSPAFKAGLLKNDILLKINGKASHQFELEDIIYKFQEKDRKKIKLLIERKGEKIKFEFYLEKRV
ncbi:MAG: aspartyl protease family protein [Polaribacter sp.]